MKAGPFFATLLVVLSAGLCPAQDGKKNTEFEMPLKTVVIRDAGTQDPASYLETRSTLRFWVYKAGSTDDVSKIVSAFKNDPAVKSVAEGPASGDYKEFSVQLKENRKKDWFVGKFRDAGLSGLRFNNGKVLGLDKI